ncbi:MAG TPA: serine protease [Micromonosporaceae bacterium]|nr:serine protease [Micromonosporaceae bacterium]
MTTGAVLSPSGHTTGEYGGWSDEAAGSTPDSEAVEEESGEVSGSSDPSGESQEAHAEVGTDAAESGEEFAEASPEALAQQEGEESATGDLLSEGYELGGAGEEAAAAEAEGLMPEAGEALEGAQEFLPLLAGLAAKVIPMLASTAGPSLVRLVQRKLSPRAKRILAKPRPGGGMVSVLQKLVAQAMKRPEVVEEAVDEALVEELTQTMEVILGTDDRIRIKNTVKVPWRRYCALRIEFPTGAVYRGTGFFIGDRTLATAGHCVYLQNQGGWARRIEVIPACNGTHRPFRSAFATTFKSTAGWTKNKVPAADYGAIILPAGAFPGQQFGRFGFKALPTQTLLAKPAVLAGYPGDKPFAELWGMRRKIKAATATNLIYDIDTMGGQSGAPVYVKDGGKRYVVGIHNYGASTGNSATRVTAEVVANFKKWGAIGTPPKTTISAPAPKAAQAYAMAGASEPSDLDM